MLSNEKDYKIGWGGKFGVQEDRKDSSAAGWDYQSKLSQHESQKGEFDTYYTKKQEIAYADIRNKIAKTAKFSKKLFSYFGLVYAAIENIL